MIKPDEAMEVLVSLGMTKKELELSGVPCVDVDLFGFRDDFQYSYNNDYECFRVFNSKKNGMWWAPSLRKSVENKEQYKDYLLDNARRNTDKALSDLKD